MRTIILAGGYAKRLWPLTLDTPKPLLPIGDGTILDFIMAKIKPLKPEETIISTNKKFEGKFAEWIGLRGINNARVVVEPSASEEEKLGPTKALSIIMRGAVPDDYLIAAGDNLFSLDLVKMAAFFKTVRSPVVALYNVRSKELAKKYACVTIDSSSKIIGFEEKPECPKSLLVSTGIFAWVAANAAEEAKQKGASESIPYWRTLKSGGAINEKYPGGVESQKRLLEAEGHSVVKKGKNQVIQCFESKLFNF